jgi:hypothetical protein
MSAAHVLSTTPSSADQAAEKLTKRISKNRFVTGHDFRAFFAFAINFRAPSFPLFSAERVGYQ